MNSTAVPTERTGAERAEQLLLLSIPDDADRELRPSSAPARFRLSTDTRRRGLAHVAEIRRLLEASRTDAGEIAHLPSVAAAGGSGEADEARRDPRHPRAA
ncbi:hypothetical protein [Ilumatobacter sp.]|uniref:hypothetical protein n=1 Tax=Ilumatobacter sp. TaxID=1967498 RepID=UPI003B51D568